MMMMSIINIMIMITFMITIMLLKWLWCYIDDNRFILYNATIHIGVLQRTAIIIIIIIIIIITITNSRADTHALHIHYLVTKIFHILCAMIKT